MRQGIGAGILAWLVVMMLSASVAWAAGTVDTKWFGWVTEDGGSHRVCGHAETTPISSHISADSGSWFEGWGTSDPPCVAYGDNVSAGWLGVRSLLYKNGSLCASSGSSYSYNSSSASGLEIGASCTNSAGSQNWQAWSGHRWWAKDSNGYAGGYHWSPIYSS